MVDNINGLFSYLINSDKMKTLGTGSMGGKVIEKSCYFQPFTGELYCPKCGGTRKCNVVQHTMDANFKIDCRSNQVEFVQMPQLFVATCLQCDSQINLFLYKGPETNELAVIHSVYGGCFTPNTPVEIKYYIDQAFRSRSAGASSAAVAMYRSALECFLYNQGFKKGMLAQKISDLEDAIAKSNDSVPKWALEIDTGFLKAIKDIGNGAIHTNGGEIAKQDTIDKELMELMDVVFAELLDKAYEQPIKSANNLARLKEKALNIK